MESAWQFLKDLTNPESIVKLGLPLLLFVIFAETGLFVGFFLPGDSLVFISGLLCATDGKLLNISIFELNVYMILAAVTGNIFGYLFGRRIGAGIYKKEDSFFFKKRHVEATQHFYEKHGGKTLFLGRFLPVIRTFAPILAGVIRIDFKKFMLYNFAGAACWIISFTCIGYFLGAKFPSTKGYLGYIVIGLIVITAIPVLTAFFRGRRKD
jgi:membrane-associated protein